MFAAYTHTSRFYTKRGKILPTVLNGAGTFMRLEFAPGEVYAALAPFFALEPSMKRYGLARSRSCAGPFLF